MSVSLLNRPMVVDDLDGFPDDGNRYEIIEGELFVSAAPSPYHQYAVLELVVDFHTYVRAHNLGRVVVAPIDVVLDEFTLVQPDIIFVVRERLDIIKPTRRVEGAPDLIVEVLSSSNRSYDLVTKANAYAKLGVREYLLVDPLARTIQAFVLRDGRYEPLLNKDGLIHSTVLTGHQLDIEAFFHRVYQQ